MDIIKRRLDTLTKEEFIEAFDTLNSKRERRFLLLDIAKLAFESKNITIDLYKELIK